jgi:hypothetical protein
MSSQQFLENVVKSLTQPIVLVIVWTHMTLNKSFGRIHQRTMLTDHGAGLCASCPLSFKYHCSRFRCNEVGFFHDGAPDDWPTLATCLTPPPYDIVRYSFFLTGKIIHIFQRQCTYFFPEATQKGTYSPHVERTNSAYKGWDVREPQLCSANAQSQSNLHWSIFDTELVGITIVTV